MIIGALTAHWSILRAVADQSIQGHPYADVLKRLDGDMGRLYRRMCLALAEANVPIETWSPPMVHLGRLAEIVLLDKPQAAAVISLAERAAPGFEEAYTAIQPRLEQLTGALLRRRFESSDPLVPLTLEDLRDATVAVVQQILGARLDALGGATLATVLARCVDTGEAEIETAPQPWGAIADNECMSFVLRRPDALEAGWPEEILRLVQEGIDQLRSAAET